MSHLHHKVSALIDGELSPHARARALAHVRGCAECRREIVETLEVKRRVNRLAPVEVSADLLDVVGSMTLPSLSAPSTSPPPTGSRPRRLRRVLVGAGSVSAFVISLAYVIGAPQTSAATPVTPAVEEFAAEFADGSGLAPLSDPAVEVLDGDPVSADVVPQKFTADLPQRKDASNSSGSVVAIGVALPTHTSGDDQRAVTQLGRALAAPAQYGYVGALVIRSYLSARVQVFRVDVQHVPGQGTRFETLGSDQPVRTAAFVAEPSGPTEKPHGSLQALDAAYDLKIDGHQRVEGRRTTVVAASQDGQLSARFWIDRKTGLLLERDLYSDGRLVRQSRFQSFELNEDGFMKHLPPEVTAPKTTPLPKDVAPALNDKGWACPEWLNTRFRLSQLNQVDADGGVMRAEYTDGLSRLSVFEERGALDASSLRGFRTVTVGGNSVYLKVGLPMMAVWESGGTVFTAVTDAPKQVVSHLIARLPHTDDAPSPGVTGRISDGLSEMVSAVSP